VFKKNKIFKSRGRYALPAPGSYAPIYHQEIFSIFFTFKQISELIFMNIICVYLVPVDELLWSSSSVSDVHDKNIDKYLKTIHTECKYILIILFLF
jgi:hypothetical protein